MRKIGLSNSTLGLKIISFTYILALERVAGLDILVVVLGNLVVALDILVVALDILVAVLGNLVAVLGNLFAVLGNLVAVLGNLVVALDTLVVALDTLVALHKAVDLVELHTLGIVLSKQKKKRETRPCTHFGCYRENELLPGLTPLFVVTCQQLLGYYDSRTL